MALDNLKLRGILLETIDLMTEEEIERELIHRAGNNSFNRNDFRGILNKDITADKIEIMEYKEKRILLTELYFMMTINLRGDCKQEILNLYHLLNGTIYVGVLDMDNSRIYEGLYFKEVERIADYYIFTATE